MVYVAVENAGVPIEGLLALLIAESALDPYAERWGSETRKAQRLIVIQDWTSLQALINDVQPDISFGMSQRIVKYHWEGNGTHTYQNVLAVRKAVFDDPARDVLEAAKRYAFNLSQVGGNILEGLMVYNYGHFASVAERATTTFQAHLASYASALRKAKEILRSIG